MRTRSIKLWPLNVKSGPLSLRVLLIAGVGVLLSYRAVAGDVVNLTGREVEAIAVAKSELERMHIPRSGNLNHYRVELERRGNEVEITFVPHQSPLGTKEAGTGGESAYGVEISYIVSLDRLKILRYNLAR